MALSETAGTSQGNVMTPELSLRLFEEGAIFVFLDVPVGTEVGIDMQVWQTGEKFKGIKMIPPGIHFIYFSAVNKEGTDKAPRTGFYHTFHKGELFARRYDPVAEDLSDSVISESVLKNLKQDLRNLDKHLGAYPFDAWRQWVSLTNRISEGYLSSRLPPNGKISSAPELVAITDQNRSKESPSPSVKKYQSNKKRSKLQQAEDLLPQMVEKECSKINYSSIPEGRYPQGSSPEEVTECQMDKSWKLEALMHSMSCPTEILSEIQFSFVNFLVGQNFQSFEHWKDLIQIVCQSDKAITKFPNLYYDFLSDLYFQMAHVPEDLFIDIVSSNNFIYNCLQTLQENIAGHNNIETKLKNKMDRFISYVSFKYKWDFDDLGENEPTLVDY